jgi:hypothetical protein
MSGDGVKVAVLFGRTSLGNARRIILALPAWYLSYPWTVCVVDHGRRQWAKDIGTGADGSHWLLRGPPNLDAQDAAHRENTSACTQLTNVVLVFGMLTMCSTELLTVALETGPG